MRTIKAQRLSLESFHQYGNFTDLIDPKGEAIGEYPAKFYRDMVSIYPGNQMLGFSVIHTDRQKMIPEQAEQHERGTEVLLPLEDDVVIFVAPATNKTYPSGKEEAFILPKGTLVTLNPGVWHKAPFPLSKDKAATLVILPEREYALDCIVVDINEDQRFEMVL